MQTTTYRAIVLATLLTLATAASLVRADVKLGSAGAVTGPIAEVIAGIMDARNFAAAQVNDNGGVLAGDVLKMVVGDSACEAKAAIDAANKLVNVEQVVAIVGPSCSGATSAMVQSVTIPAGVAVLSDTASAPSISELDDNDLVLRVMPSDAYQGLAIAQLVRQADLSKVAVTYANDDYNVGIAQVFEREFSAMGGEISGKQAHEPNKASYRAELSTLAKTGPEALVIFAYYGSGGTTIIRNSLENSLFDRFYGADGLYDDALIELIGAQHLRDRIWITQPGSDQDDASFQAFSNEFSAAGGNPAGPGVTAGYDATFLMALAIENAGSTARDSIVPALRAVATPPGEVVRPGEWAKAKGLIARGIDINYEGASGKVDFDENGDVGGRYRVAEVGDDGSWSMRLLD